MHYVGEHLFPGKLGQFFITVSFVASLVAAIAYFLSVRAKDISDQAGWKKLARTAYGVNAVMMFAVFFTIYYIVRHHLFEYNFAWEHSGKTLPSNYLLACIWEAQEGSFLLWMLWQAILGLILIRTAGKWEGPVMTVIASAQFFLCAMIIGVYFFGMKVGNSPFLLVRQVFIAAPIFQRADYLSIPQMQDGQSLNALLQNYWMVIHPPILFLGFASTIVPFAFAIAGLWTREYKGWTKAVLPWTLFSCCILGTGIMMGAAWAYESLTFGGYWAWDPVENASLVPWLVLVAGLHTLVVYNATGHSLRSTCLFLILGYTLMLYATYLTRSGRLGDTSVHAFVGSGMEPQLIVFILAFLAPALILFIRRYREIPHIAREEETWSREFWMFIGSLVIFLAALFIIVATSLPILNKLFGTSWSTGDDALFAYNRIMIFIAFILGTLTATVQYLRYRNTTRKIVALRLLWPTIIAVALTILIVYATGLHYDAYGSGFRVAIYLAMFAAVYAVVGNTGYLFTGLRGKLAVSGGSVAHTGFGLLLIGILISSAKKEVLSFNTTGIDIPFTPEQKQNPLENITLLKNVRTDMGKYWATYEASDSMNKAKNIVFFRVKFEDKKTGENFALFPNLIHNTKGSDQYSNNPDKRHYLGRDIFTYITYANIMDGQPDTGAFKSYPVALHDTIFYSKGFMILDSVIVNPSFGKYHFGPGDTALLARIRVLSKDSILYRASPLLYIRDNAPHAEEDTVFEQNLVVSLGPVVSGNRITVRVKESRDLVPFVSLKAYIFPQINLVWLGVIIMISGFVISGLRRRKGVSAIT